MAKVLEPAFLQDITGSMDEMVADGVYVRKNVLAMQIARKFVSAFEGLDAQAADEGEDEGGVWFTTFAKGKATNMGDLNSKNFDSVWNKIIWDGGTYITKGFEKAKAHFDEEFAEELNDPEIEDALKPTLFLFVITDGALGDLDAACAWLSNVRGRVMVNAIIIGSGKDHDAAVRSWKGIEATNDHVFVDEYTGIANADAIVTKMLSRLG